MIFYRLVLPLYSWAGRKMADDCVSYVKKGSKFLDLGCGSGIISREFEKKFDLDLTGIDIVDNRVIPIKFQLADGERLPFEDNGFDAVLISFVLHHTDDPAKVINEARRVTRNGGRIIVFEDLYEGFFAKMICNLHGGTYGLLFEHHAGKEQYHFNTQLEWDRTFADAGLKLIFSKRVSSKLNPIHKRLFVLEK